MCGILGMVGKNSANFVSRNLDFLEKRGPDSKKIAHVSDSLSLGATRLAMVDRHARSNQPLIDENGNLIIYNGEIYNYLNLRKTLSNSGVNFHTESDTEVLLKLLTLEGDKAISKLQGMFAFAFYNKKNNTILLGRDFLGKKPLYFSTVGGQFVFSSSINIVKNSLNYYNLNPQAIFSYFKIGYILDPATMYKEIKSVAPGEFLLFDVNKLEIIERGIRLPDSLVKNNELSIEEALSEAIKQRVSGHSKFAISLSGGIDSSIVALLCKENGFSPNTYSLGFSHSDKPRYSEDSIMARQIAKKLNLEFELVEMPKPEVIPSILQEFVRSMEEPNSNPTGLSMMWLYSKISNDGHKMVLTGDGGDEIFGGYPRYSKIMSTENFPSLSDRFISKKITDKNKFSKNLIRFLSRPDSKYLWSSWHSLLSDLEITELYDYTGELNLESPIFDKIYSRFGVNSKTSALMIRDLVIWLSAESNKKLDRVSMNYSLEARSPFQSEEVICAGYSEMKKNQYKSLDKRILVEGINRISRLPLVDKKIGFLSPLGFWLRSNPKLIADSLEQVRSRIFIRDAALSKIKESAIKKDSHNFKILWSLVVLAQWFELNL